MTRLHELEKKYPDLPREFILRWDILNHGVRDSEDLDKVSEFHQFHHSYQSYHHDVTLKELVEKRPEKRLKHGHVMQPMSFYANNGIGAPLKISTRSPYEVREIGDGRFAFFEGEEKVDVDIYFPLPRPWEGEGPVTSRGTPIKRLIEYVHQWAYVSPLRFCEYFTTGEQCKFCNFNTTQDDASSAGAGRPLADSLEETVEAYKILTSQVSPVSVSMEGGNFLQADEVRIQANLLGTIAKVTPYKPSFRLVGLATSRKSMERLKDAGVDCVTIQMEVWDPNLFAEILPGKARRMPHEAWLEAFLNAVDIFGPGYVSGKIIAGLTLIPQNGHKKWQEALACHIEGNRWMIKNGVLPITSHLRLPPGSVYGADPSLREKLPPTEYYLEMALAHHADMMEYRLHEKWHRYLYAFSLASPFFIGDLTVWDIASNRDHWIADMVAAQATRLAQFIPAVESAGQAATGGQSVC